jgi:hypothetical protein
MMNSKTTILYTSYTSTTTMTLVDFGESYTLDKQLYNYADHQHYHSDWIQRRIIILEHRLKRRKSVCLQFINKLVRYPTSSTDTGSLIGWSFTFWNYEFNAVGINYIDKNMMLQALLAFISKIGCKIYSVPSRLRKISKLFRRHFWTQLTRTNQELLFP